MAEPKPITLTQVDPEDYSGPAPQPFEIVGPLPTGAIPAATEDTIGGVTQGAAVPDAEAAPTQAEFNALLGSLRASGVIAS